MQIGEQVHPVPTQGLDAGSSSGRVVTLEQFIVDTFTRIDDDGVETPVDQPDQIGGGGTYAIIGARMFLPPTKLGMVIDYTPSTLSKEMRETLKGYGEDMWGFRERSDGHPTARAVNRYQGQTRGFAYLTEPLILSPLSISNTSIATGPPSVIHFISYPAPRAERVLSEIDQLRQEHSWDPTVVWEPEEEGIDVVRRVARDVDVIGPNHHEILRLFDLRARLPVSPTDDALRSIYEEGCRHLVAFQPKVGVVVRCGHLGACYALTPERPSSTTGSTNECVVVRETGLGEDDTEVQVVWVPAYWSPSRPGWRDDAVVDPTGAGNAFMGGLAAALDSGQTLHEAVIWGSVAASFTIEQDGLPILSLDEDRTELWNGQYPRRRVGEMKAEHGNVHQGQ